MASTFDVRATVDAPVRPQDLKTTATAAAPAQSLPAQSVPLQSLPAHSAPAPTLSPLVGQIAGQTPDAWPRKYARVLVALDSVAIALAILVAYVARFAILQEGPTRHAWSYLLISVGLFTAWLLALTIEKTRDRRLVGIGSAEYGRVWNASWLLFSGVAIVAYVFRVDLARGYVAIAFPVGVMLLVIGRFAARQQLKRMRSEGRGMSRVIVTGSDQGLNEVISELHANPAAGYHVVGACVPGGDPLGGQRINDVPVLGDILDVPQAVRLTRATAVAVVGSEQLTGGVVRKLGYELEASGTDLIVAPALIDVAGPRVVMSPVEGLSLVHVDAPTFTGIRYAIKSVLDWILALGAVLVLAVPTLVIGVLIRVTSTGPALFRQERVGRNGKTFKMLKFRSMRVGAEAELAGLMGQNEGSGPLFKLRDDPRVTAIGAVLRKYSLDELPQFLNVLRGDMSLVGPRPPLATEVAEYDGHAARRMLVKPGLTGLWQVSGRSDLPWEDGVRKDVYYVENWTVFGDLLIMLRTARTMLFPDGAY